MDESAPSEHVDLLAGEHRQLSERLAHLDAVIGAMGDVVPLRSVDAALLEKYRRTRNGLEWKLATIECELRKLDRHSGDDLMISIIDQTEASIYGSVLEETRGLAEGLDA